MQNVLILNDRVETMSPTKYVQRVLVGNKLYIITFVILQ